MRFPVAERRREIFLKTRVSTLPPPDLVDTSDDEAAGQDLGAEGSSPKGEDPTNPTSPLVEAKLEYEPSTKKRSPAIGKDTRGVGLETFDGRGAVRKHKGYKRPHSFLLSNGESAPPTKKLKP